MVISRVISSVHVCVFFFVMFIDLNLTLEIHKTAWRF